MYNVACRKLLSLKPTRALINVEAVLRGGDDGPIQDDDDGTVTRVTSIYACLRKGHACSPSRHRFMSRGCGDGGSGGSEVGARM